MPRYHLLDAAEDLLKEAKEQLYIFMLAEDIELIKTQKQIIKDLKQLIVYFNDINN